MINNPEASFEGIVISDKDNANVETTPNTERNATDYTVNAKTAYVQMLDGSYGYRLQFDAADDNTLKRYSQVKISLNGVTLTKEADPERYTLSGLTAANIVSQTPGTASDLIRKEKSIGQLTDEDIYTYVSLREVEFALPDGSYTNVNEGYFGTANHTSCVPRTLCDKDGGAISMLVNNKTPWRRDGSGMPKGKGTLSGVIVHDLQPRYGYTNEGYIGRYSVRVLEKEEIDLAASESSSNRQTLVEWNWNNAEVRTNADGTIAPDRGNGSLWCTDPAAKYLLDNEYNGLTTSAGLNSKNALKFENTYWWDFAENTGYAVALKFSTEGAGANLSLNFTNSQGNAGATSIHRLLAGGVLDRRGELHRAARIGLLLPAVRLLAGSRRQRPLLLRRPGLRRPRVHPAGRPAQPPGGHAADQGPEHAVHRLEHRHGGPGRHGHDHIRHGGQQAFADAFRNHSRKE